jgi:cyclic lactone autoinducer peptide
MKGFAAKVTNGVVTWFAKKLAETGCFLGCNAPEIPDELLK